MFGIERDREKFRRIVRGQIKQDLRKYMSQDGMEIYGKDGQQKIKVPIPYISLPRFIFGQKGGGVGQGGAGEGAGKETGEHPLEVEITLEEMANLIGEELELPRIVPKGKSQVEVDSHRYRSTKTVGPESLRHFKKTFIHALKRSVVTGEYDPKNPIVLPIKEDKRYRASKPFFIPHNQAVIIYIMDVSGSMGEPEKERARLTSFWIDLWLRSQYKNIVSRYIIHDTQAVEVDRHTFYHTQQSGGTHIASAYKLSQELIKIEFPPEDWNIYVFQYSDGEDWTAGSADSIAIIRDLLGCVNQISYCEVHQRGTFKQTLDKTFGSNRNIVTATAYEKTQILDAIKEFFKTGN